MKLCLSIEAKRRIVSLHSCGKALLNIYLSMFLAWLLHALLFHTWHTVNYMRHVCSISQENVDHANT